MVHQSESVQETSTYIGLEGSLDSAHKGLEFRHGSTSAINTLRTGDADLRF